MLSLYHVTFILVLYKMYEIRADYDMTTIVVYQAYSPLIADLALKTNHFVEPFSFNRMTWIKPSFLWLMERSNWGLKTDQERILAIRITRIGWERALSTAVLSRPEKDVHANEADWRTQFNAAPVAVQWDPERTIRGTLLPHRSIQVGIGRRLIREYAEQWIVNIEDYTPKTRQIYNLLKVKDLDAANQFLPPERVYPVDSDIMKRLGMDRD